MENRKLMDKKEFDSLLDMKELANLIKMWAFGENRPENLSFIGF